MPKPAPKAPAAPGVLTPAEARAALRANGLTTKAWAEAHGFKRETVMDLLLGRRAGHYGEAHRAAVALGLKAGRATVDPAGFKPARHARA